MIRKVFNQGEAIINVTRSKHIQYYTLKQTNTYFDLDFGYITGHHQRPKITTDNSVFFVLAIPIKHTSETDNRNNTEQKEVYRSETDQCNISIFNKRFNGIIVTRALILNKKIIS